MKHTWNYFVYEVRALAKSHITEEQENSLDDPGADFDQASPLSADKTRSPVNLSQLAETGLNLNRFSQSEDENLSQRVNSPGTVLSENDTKEIFIESLNLDTVRQTRQVSGNSKLSNQNAGWFSVRDFEKLCLQRYEIILSNYDWIAVEEYLTRYNPDGDTRVTYDEFISNFDSTTVNPQKPPEIDRFGDPKSPGSTPRIMFSEEVTPVKRPRPLSCERNSRLFQKGFRFMHQLAMKDTTQASLDFLNSSAESDFEHQIGALPRGLAFRFVQLLQDQKMQVSDLSKHFKRYDKYTEGIIDAQIAASVLTTTFESLTSEEVATAVSCYPDPNSNGRMTYVGFMRDLFKSVHPMLYHRRFERSQTPAARLIPMATAERTFFPRHKTQRISEPHGGALALHRPSNVKPANDLRERVAFENSNDRFHYMKPSRFSKTLRAKKRTLSTPKIKLPIIKKKVENKWDMLTHALEQFDPFGDGVVTSSQMKRVLSTILPSLNRDEFERLRLQFEENGNFKYQEMAVFLNIKIDSQD